MSELKQLLSRRVIYLRQRAGMTQEELAQAAGVGLDAIGRLERGQVTPSVDTLQAIAQVFQLDLSEFFRFEGMRAPNPVLDELDEPGEWYLDRSTGGVSGDQTAGRYLFLLPTDPRCRKPPRQGQAHFSGLMKRTKNPGRQQICPLCRTSNLDRPGGRYRRSQTNHTRDSQCAVLVNRP